MVGVLQLFQKDAGVFDERDVEIGTRLARLLSGALRDSDMHERLRWLKTR
jgi:hypothetical protein